MADSYIDKLNINNSEKKIDAHAINGYTNYKNFTAQSEKSHYNSDGRSEYISVHHYNFSNYVRHGDVIFVDLNMFVEMKFVGFSVSPNSFTDTFTFGDESLTVKMTTYTQSSTPASSTIRVLAGVVKLEITSSAFSETFTTTFNIAYGEDYSGVNNVLKGELFHETIMIPQGGGS